MTLADTIEERMKCNGPLDSFARHVGVHTIEDFLKWVEMERRSNMGMIVRHEMGIHKMSEDIEDFVYGKSAVLWEVHVNLLDVMRGVDGKG